MNIDSFTSLNMVHFCQVVFLIYYIQCLYIVSPSYIFVLYSILSVTRGFNFTLHVGPIHLFACEYVRQSVPGSS